MGGTLRLLSSVSLAWWVTSAYLVVLSYVLLTPDPLWFLGDESLENAIDSTVADKIQHAFAYALLSLLLVWASRKKGRRTIALMMLLASGHAIGTELLQAVVPSRYFSVGDGIANICGILFGGCLFYAIRQLAHVLAFSRPHSTTRTNSRRRETTVDG